MMKKYSYLLLLVGAFACLACKTNHKVSATPPTICGADSDEHGCKASAGYTWSELKQECVRIWEAGSKLVCTNTANNQEETLFVVFNNDSTQLETFGANQQLWTRVENTTSWTSADKKQNLEQTTEGWILK